MILSSKIITAILLVIVFVQFIIIMQSQNSNTDCGRISSEANVVSLIQPSTSPNILASCHVVSENIPIERSQAIKLSDDINDARLISLIVDGSEMDGEYITDGPLYATAFQMSSTISNSNLDAIWILAVVDGDYIKMIEFMITQDSSTNSFVGYVSSIGYVNAISYDVTTSSKLIPNVVKTAWDHRTPQTDKTKYRISELHYCICEHLPDTPLPSTPTTVLRLNPSITDARNIYLTPSTSVLNGAFISNGPIACVVYPNSVTETRAEWIFAAVNDDFIKMVLVTIVRDPSNKFTIQTTSSGYSRAITHFIKTTSQLTSAIVYDAWSSKIDNMYDVYSISYYALSYDFN